VLSPYVILPIGGDAESASPSATLIDLRVTCAYALTEPYARPDSGSRAKPKKILDTTNSHPIPGMGCLRLAEISVANTAVTIANGRSEMWRAGRPSSRPMPFNHIVKKPSHEKPHQYTNNRESHTPPERVMKPIMLIIAVLPLQQKNRLHDQRSRKIDAGCEFLRICHASIERRTFNTCNFPTVRSDQPVVWQATRRGDEYERDRKRQFKDREEVAKAQLRNVRHRSDAVVPESISD
jgi:hypothetical protein